MKKTLIGIFLALGIVTSFISLPTVYAAVTFRTVQTPSLHLYVGLSAAGTSMRITPFPKDLDGNKLSMTDFGSTPTVTVDPKITNYEEIISFTGMTDNGDNTATLTGLTRDLTSKYPYTTAGTGKQHGAGAVVVFSNNPQLYGRLASKENDETITGAWGFNVAPTSSVTCANQNEYCPKSYIDAESSAGAATATEAVIGLSWLSDRTNTGSSTASSTSGAPLVIENKFATTTPGTLCTSNLWKCIVATQLGKISQSFLDLTASFAWTGAHTFSSTVAFSGAVSATASTTLATTTLSTGARVFNNNIANTYTAGETISGAGTPVPVMFSTTTTRVFKVLANTASTTNFIGFAVNNSAVAGTAYVQTDGVVSGFSGLTAGARYYVADAGGLGAAETVGTDEVYVGFALSSTQIQIDKGPASAWQYVGASCTNIPSFARFALVNISGSNGSRNMSCEVTLSRFGKTTGSCSLNGDGTVSVSINASWSGSSITGSSPSCTLYR